MRRGSRLKAAPAVKTALPGAWFKERFCYFIDIINPEVLKKCFGCHFLFGFSFAFKGNPYY